MRKWNVSAVAVALAAMAMADHGMLVEMMDVSRETGRQPAKTGMVRTCGGKIHWRSLNVVAPSRVTIPLGRGATRFDATPSVPDGSKASVLAFRVLTPAGKVLWEKADVTKGKEVGMTVSVADLDAIELEVSGPEGATAAWAEARFRFLDGMFPPNDVRMNSRQLGILTPKAPPVPRINGPRVLGVRPGHPILFRVPVTGEGPMKVEVCSARSGTDRAPCGGRSCGAIGDCPSTGARSVPDRANMRLPSCAATTQSSRTGARSVPDRATTRLPSCAAATLPSSTGARSVPDRAATRLPPGLAFDPSTRILSGQIDEPGECNLVFKATNAKGTAERDFTIKVGETISLTPAMGWNSWNCFASGVTAEKVKAAADAMVTSGLADHGWQYVNIDDFWENNEKKGKADETLRGPARHPDGTIATNRRFPDMKGLADYVHAKGLKIGLYSSPGPTTCGGCTGSWRHEAQDAKTFADWGFDFLKYDWCSYTEVAMGAGLQRAMYPYLVMGKALREQNRDILFSLCQYGMENVSAWGFLVGGSSWRTTGDVFDTWKSISGAIERQKQLWYYSRPGGWNDPDMLCVGKMTWNEFAGSRLAPNEQYTHISLWALVASPLMIGCDMTKLDDFTSGLLTNDEVIEIDQDPLGKGAARVAEGNGCEIWARPLADGSVAMGLYNKTLKEREVHVDLRALGLEGKWRIRDVWRQADEGVFEGAYAKSVPGHATHLVRLWPSAGGGFRRGMTDIRENAWRLEIAAAVGRR